MRDFIENIAAWFRCDSESPKGRFRMKEAAILGVGLLVIAYLFDSVMFGGWVSQSILQFSKAGMAAFAFYWLIQRRVIHTRTHELDGNQKSMRENVLAICYAIIIGCALSI